jgi:hypothetical protein
MARLSTTDVAIASGSAALPGSAAVSAVVEQADAEKTVAAIRLPPPRSVRRMNVCVS